jgi:gas vesicle protein
LIAEKENGDMVWNRQEHRNHFWSGFFAGAAVGGALGLFLASEVGRRAYQQLESAAQEMRSRLNGELTSDGQGAALEEDEQEVAHPASEEDAEDAT